MNDAQLSNAEPSGCCMYQQIISDRFVRICRENKNCAIPSCPSRARMTVTDSDEQLSWCTAAGRTVHNSSHCSYAFARRERRLSRTQSRDRRRRFKVVEKSFAGGRRCVVTCRTTHPVARYRRAGSRPDICRPAWAKFGF